MHALEYSIAQILKAQGECSLNVFEIKVTTFLVEFVKEIINKKEKKKRKIRKTQKYSLSKCLLRHDVVRVLCRSLC